MTKRSYRSGAGHIVVSVERHPGGSFTAAVGETSLAVEATMVSASELQLVVDGCTYGVRIARIGTSDHVAVAGEVHVLTPEAAPAGTTDQHAVLAPPQIVAPMPGKVLQVLVRSGDHIAPGDGLLILEAMKMEHRIVAEAAGTVRAVYVTDGQMVDGGAVMLELDYD